VIYISYPFPGFLYSSTERLYSVFNIPYTSTRTHTYMYTWFPMYTHMCCISWLGSAYDCPLRGAFLSWTVDESFIRLS